jgi:hypothetical protein
MSYSYTTSSTFTVTHARYLASKVAADLRQMQIFYGKPTGQEIEDYLVELVALLLKGYVEAVEYGFLRQGQTVLALKYRATAGFSLSDDHSGRVPAGADVSGARWYSYLWKTKSWWELPVSERIRIESSLPVQRSAGSEPVGGDGFWVNDKSYSSQNVNLQRSTFRS